MTPLSDVGSDKFDAIVRSINRKKSTDLMVTWLNLDCKTAKDASQTNSIQLISLVKRICTMVQEYNYKGVNFLSWNI